MNKKASKVEVKTQKNKKRRKVGFWWWSVGATLSLATVVAVTANLNSLNSSSAVSSAVSSTTSVASSSVSSSVEAVSLTAIEISKLPTKTSYTPAEALTTSGGELMLVFSDFSIKFISMNDAMLDLDRINLGQLGTNRVAIRYTFNGVTLNTFYEIVVSEYVLPVSNVSFSVRELTVSTDQSIKLEYLVQPPNAIVDEEVWTSDNTLVATVDQLGNVQTKNAGETFINVSVNGKFLARTKIIVSAPIVFIAPSTPTEEDDYEEGDPLDWIPIATIKDLDMIRYFDASHIFAQGTSAAVSFTNNTPGMAGKYYLLNNINFTGFDNSDYEWAEFTRDSNSFMPLGFVEYGGGQIEYSSDFTGEFDGNNKSINNMVIKLDNSTNYYYVGLFSAVSEAEIYDLSILNAVIEQDSNRYNYVGILAGYAVNSAIENIDISGNIIAYNNVGGLIGRLETSTVEDASFAGTISGHDNVGGLIGSARYAQDDNFLRFVYSSANVSGEDNVGGLIGELRDSVLENANAGTNLLTFTITGDEDIGGLVGRVEDSVVTNVNSYNNVIGDDEIGGLIGSIQQTVLTNSNAYGNVEGRFEISGLEYDSGENEIYSVTIGSLSSFGGLLGEVEYEVIVNNSNAYGDVTGLNFDKDEFLLQLTEEINLRAIQLSIENTITLANPLIVYLNSENGPYKLVYNIGGLIGDIDIDFDDDDDFATQIISSESFGDIIGLKFTSVLENPFEYKGTTINLEFESESVYDLDDEEATILVNRIGGLVGEVNEVDNYPVEILDSISHGNVYGVKFDNLSSNNTLLLSGVVDVGGFIGFIGADTYVSNSISNGDTYGITGISSNGKVEIDKVFNIGGFIGSSYLYYFSNSSEEMRLIDVENFGDVYGLSISDINNIESEITNFGFIGGLVGRIGVDSFFLTSDKTGFINNATNSGNVYGINLNTFNGELNVNTLFQSDEAQLGFGVGGAIGLVQSIIINNLSNSSTQETEVVGIKINNYTGLEAIRGFDSIGGLIGKSELSRIDNTFNDANVYALKLASNVNDRDILKLEHIGGLIGYSENDSIQSSSSTANVYGVEVLSQATRAVAIDENNLDGDFSKFVGGLVGTSYLSTLIDVNSTGQVQGHYAVGGLVGSVYVSTIRDAHSTSKITGTSSVGGLVGLSVFGEYNKVYYLNTVSNQNYNIKGLNDVGGLIGQGMHPHVENAYARFDKIIATYRVGGLSGRIWNDYSSIYGTLNSIEYVYAIGSIELNTDLMPVTAYGNGGLIGEVESVVKNAFVDVDITPTSLVDQFIGDVFGIIVDPNSINADENATQVGKIYFVDQPDSVTVGYNEINAVITGIESKTSLEILNFTFLSTGSNWSDETAWDVTDNPSGTFKMWNLSGSTLSLTSQSLFSITATLDNQAISLENPITLAENDGNDGTLLTLVITLTLNSNDYSIYVPSDPVMFNFPDATTTFSTNIPTGLEISHVISENKKEIEVTISTGISNLESSNFINQFVGFITVFTIRDNLPSSIGNTPSDLYNQHFIDLPIIIFDFLEDVVITEEP